MRVSVYGYVGEDVPTTYTCGLSAMVDVASDGDIWMGYRCWSDLVSGNWQGVVRERTTLCGMRSSCAKRPEFLGPWRWA